MKLVYFCSLAAVVVTQAAFADDQALQSFALKNHVLTMQTSHGQMELRLLRDDILENRFIPKGKSASPARASHAVQLHRALPGMQLEQQQNLLKVQAGQMLVEIQKSPMRLRYYAQGRFLFEDIVSDRTENGLALTELVVQPDEVLYGGGARALGMNRRGHRLPLYNKAHYGYEEQSLQMNFAMPLFLSSQKYAVHFDQPSTGFLDLDSQNNNRVVYGAGGDTRTYQVLAGTQWPQLIDAYTTLTGRQPMPARWTLGNFASRFGYHSAEEALKTVALFRAEKIPLDAIVFDLFWFGKEVKGTMGNLAFDKDNFPDPAGMMASLKKQQVRTVLITEPFILTSSGRWEEAKQNAILATGKDGKPYEYDFYFGHTGLIDITKPAARDWFWQRYAELKTLGADGWWGDLGEPEVHPDDIRHAGGSAAEVHNIYGHEWAKLIAEKSARFYPKERPFILMRAGYSGSQRFGMIPWSGDVNRSWGGLRSQPEIALQMGLQGMAYMHSDLGGFAGAVDDDELYTRWLQYGVFQPVFRPHAQEEVPAEPVYRRHAAKALAKAAIELRYRLLPYNYTLAFENHRSGMPLMRPLFFAADAGAEARTSASAYFWGNDFLVFPVLNAGQKTMQVSFPHGHDWIDFYSGVTYAGGSQHQLVLSSGAIPVFVKSGAMIPMAEGLQSTEDFRVEDLNWHIYPQAVSETKASESQLYDDDGKTRLAWEQQAFALTRLSQQHTAEGLLLTVDEKAGRRYQSVPRQWTMYVHGVTKEPQAVTVDDKTQTFSYDAAQKLLRFTLTFKPGSRHLIRLPGLQQVRG